MKAIHKLYVVLLVIPICFSACLKSNEKVLTVGFPSDWGSIDPPIQYSAYADAIISNQFETLVRVNKNGMIEPLVAVSWSVSPNFDELKFKIDTNRRFSNGKHLTAMDVKRSWEQGLRMTPEDLESTFKELLKGVEGYDDFNRDSAALPGLVVEGDYFIIKFKKPFRSVLSFMSNNRLGIFLDDGGKFLGTGPYYVSYDNGSYLEMLPNKYFSGHRSFSKIRMVVVSPEDAEARLNDGSIDAYLFAEKAIIKACYAKWGSLSKTKCISGTEGRHEHVSLNGLTGRFFSNPKYRIAMQALLISEMKKTGLPDYLKLNSTVLDKQVFLKFQPGRLEDAEARQIVSEGDKYIPLLLEATKKKPLYLITSDKPNWIQNILQKRGIVFDKRSGCILKEALIKQYHSGFSPDMIVGGANVANGDPDNLYHALGFNGSHSTKILERPKTIELLEIGRSILNRAEINEHYKDVSRAILREVPFVHIGFSKGVIAYRSDRVKVSANVKNRSVYSLDIFEPY